MKACLLGTFTRGDPETDLFGVFQACGAIATHLSWAGIVAFAIDQRLGQPTGHHNHAQFENVCRTVRWVPVYVDFYGVDPGRQGVFGYSTDVYIAVLLGFGDAWEKRDFFAMAIVRLGLGKTTLGAPTLTRYARASTDDHGLAFHTVELRRAACEQTFLGDMFGKRPEHARCAETLSQLRLWASDIGPPRT